MNKSLLLCAFVFISLNSEAQTSSVSISSVGDASSNESTTESPNGTTTQSLRDILKNKKIADDHILTDARLKADAGSLSEYSVKFSLSYMGPPVGDLGSRELPNPDQSVGTHLTSLGGSIGARYRWNADSAFNLGTGLTVLTPIQGASRYDMRNPFISYDHSARIDDIQMRNSVGFTKITNPDLLAVGDSTAVSLENAFVHDLGASGFATELDAGVSYHFFSREPKKKSKRELRSARYTASLVPQLKYNYSDRLSNYVGVAMNFINPRGEDDQTILWNRTLSERLGLGYAFTRDIYIAPYISFYPKNTSMNSTTVNFSTIFSIL